MSSFLPSFHMQIWVLICTDVMGRGIDFKGVNLVLNYDFPPTAVSYIHRIGTDRLYRIYSHVIIIVYRKNWESRETG